MDKNAKIFIAGHRGMVGSALVRKLQAEGFGNLLLRSRQELDLTDQAAVADFFHRAQPEYVFLAAAKVGGILANQSFKAQFIYENLMIQSNVIHQAYLHQVKKLLFLGSSCIYPKMAPQPIPESALLSSKLEPSNQPYAIAKIAGIEMCQAYRHQYGANFIACMPTNLYGPNDNYHLENSHVFAALIRKFFEAKQEGKQRVCLWGDGSPQREFLYVDDLVDACLFLMNHYEESDIINVGTGKDISIKSLAEMIGEATGFSGQIDWDSSKPNGTPRKWLDTRKMEGLGWNYQTELAAGIQQTLADFIQGYTHYIAPDGAAS